MPAGSRPGERRGGRKPGTPNKASIARQQAIMASGLAPLDYMLAVMRNESNTQEVRLDAANKAAPYVHPKLSAIEHTGKGGGPIEVANLSDDQLAAIATGRGAGIAPPPVSPQKLN